VAVYVTVFARAWVNRFEFLVTVTGHGLTLRVKMIVGSPIAQ